MSFSVLVSIEKQARLLYWFSCFRSDLVILGVGERDDGEARPGAGETPRFQGHPRRADGHGQCPKGRLARLR